MPEGDTIFRAARTLHRALAGTVVTSFDSVFPKLTRVHVDTPITGRTIESVTASGKHLLMAFSGGLVLRTHMRMNGSWHIYRPGERWQRGRGDMRIVIATAGYVAVGFNIPVAEWLKAGALERHPELRRLGPDLLAEDFDAQEATRRVRATPDAEISDVLLNQRVMAGIGNVYKSEVLFACRVDPFAAVRTLSDEQVACLVTTARRFLRDNVSEGLAAIPTPGPPTPGPPAPRPPGPPDPRTPGPRTSPGFRRTTRRDHPGERLWVYGRAGEPCRRCGTPVKIAKQGRGPRLTYWCPQCQS